MKEFIPQLIPQEFCLKCEICCRFTEKFSPWAPFILREEIDNFTLNLPSFIKSYGINIMLKKENNFYICPFFDISQNKCTYYRMRPLDCRLYPFILFYDQSYTKIMLGIDSQCPYIREKDRNILNFAQRIKDILENKNMQDVILQNPGIIMSYNKNFIPLFPLENISKKIFGEDSSLKLISIEDKDIFKKYLDKSIGNFSFAFEYIYSWKDIVYLLWRIIDDNLLVFWKQKDSLFLLLPPLGEVLSSKTLDYLCYILGKKPIIENVEENFLNILKEKNIKFHYYPKTEYIYERKDIAELKGEKFKSQRWAYNYFKKNNKFRIRELTPGDIEDCLKLYEIWAKEKMRKNIPEYFRLLIEDNFFAQRRLLLDYALLELKGIALENEKGIIGYSFGYPLNEKTFCIFSEIANPKYKGIFQYLFCEFCKELKEFRFINTMDDAELKNLQKTKISYHPLMKYFYTCFLDYGEGFI